MSSPPPDQSPSTGVPGEEVAGPVLRLRPEAVDWREVEGQIVALDRGRSVYLAVNPSGTKLLPALVTGATREQLVQTLRKEFGLDPERAEADVDAFVATLSERELLES